MNYLAEILAFNNWIRYNSAVNKSDICLWYSLMFMANRFAWKEFTAPILTLLSESKLTKNEFYKSRNKLKQFGLIDFKERSGNKATVYKINSVVSLYEKQIQTQTVIQNDTQINTQTGTQTVNINKTRNQKLKTKSKDISLTTFEIYNNCDENTFCEQVCKSTNSTCQRKSTYRINGKNYCNQHSKEILKNIETCEVSQSKNLKQVFGEFENVLLAKEELDKLQSRLGEQTDSYIERLSNYIASTGKRYKSHYATILSWIQKENQNNQVRGETYGNIGRLPDKKLCTEYPE